VSLDKEAKGESYLAPYTGIETRTGMVVDQFHQAGYLGQHGSRVGGAVRIGIFGIDPEFNWKHPGLGGFAIPLTSSHINIRAGGYRNCNGVNCVSYLPPAVASHETMVAGVLLGSIENGEDLYVTNQFFRRERSGIAPGAGPFYYYWAGANSTASSRIAALQQAILDGIDILNFSNGWAGCPSPCMRTCDGSGYRQAFANSQAAGLLSVFAAGNWGPNGCTVDAPASFRQGLVVGSLYSKFEWYNPHTLQMSSTSAAGGMDIVVNGYTYAGGESLLDMVAPGCRSLMYTHGEAPYGNYSGETCGTSFAAPAVAGMAALVRNAFVSQSFLWMKDPDFLLALSLLMADGWAAIPNAVTVSGFDRRSGAGRAHAWMRPNLVPPWGWWCHGVKLSKGKTYSFPVGDAGPESPAITLWKSAMYFKEPNYSNAADIDLRVWNTCPPGGGSHVVVASDVSRDTRSRLRLTQSNVANKCLEVEVSAYHVPPGQTRDVFVCDYYQSGPVENH